jgi:uncharacterized protein (TIGR02246 family)
MEEHTLAGILGSFADAFNARDAAALAALFTEQGDLVNIIGVRMPGRAGIEAGHAKHFAGALGGTRLTFTDHTVRLVRDARPGVAVCHAQWRRETLPDAPAGALPPGTGIFTLVLLEEPSGWKIDAAHNVQHAALPR